MCLQIVSESLTSIVMVKIYCSEMFRTWMKIRCLFQDRFVKTFLFIIPSLSRPWITNISCFGETTKKFNIHPDIWIWHWTSIQLYPIPRSITNYILKSNSVTVCILLLYSYSLKTIFDKRFEDNIVNITSYRFQLLFMLRIMTADIRDGN